MRILFLLGSLIAISGASVSLEEVKKGGIMAFQHAGATSEVICHPDGVHVLSSSREGCVRLWELKTGKLVRRFIGEGGGSMWGIRFINEGKEFLAANSDSKVYRFEVASGRVLKTYQHPDDVYRLAVHPDGKHFVATGAGKMVILWEIETGKKVRSFDGHTGSVYTAILVEGGKRLITGASDDTLRQWDVESGECLKVQKEKPKYDTIYTIRASPDGKRFAMVSLDKRVRVFESATLEEVWKTKLKEKGQVIAWSPDGKLVATPAGDEKIYLLNAADGKTVHVIDVQWKSHTPVAFSTDSRILISGGDYLLHLHDVETGRQVEPGMGFADRYDSYDAMAVGDRGGRIYLADGDEVTVIDREDETKNQSWDEGANLYTMVLSKDGRLLATAGQGGEIVVRETAGLEVVTRMSAGREVNALDFSADGSQLVSGGGRGAVFLWRVEDGKKVRELEGHKEEINAVAFIPGGGQVVTAADDRTVRFWSPQNGVEQGAYRLKKDPGSFFTLDDGRSLGVAVGNGELYGRIQEKLEKKEISDPAEVQRLLGLLGDEEYRKREDAMRGLAEFGREVLPILAEVESEDPEVRARLVGVRNVMSGKLTKDGLDSLKTFEDDLEGLVGDPKGEFWVGLLGESGVAKIVVGVIDHEKKGVKIVQTIDTVHGCDRLVFSPDGSHVGAIHADGSYALYRVNRD